MELATDTKMKWGEALHRPQRYKHITRIIRDINAKILVEIGVGKAVRSRQMILTALETPGKVTFYGFDLFEDMTLEQCRQEACQMPYSESHIRNLLTTPGVRVYLIKGDTKYTLRKCKIIHPDFIFIDGGHSQETIKADWNWIQFYIGDNTTLIFDDYLSEYEQLGWGCNPVIDNLSDSAEYKVEILEPPDTYLMQKVPYDESNERILCQTRLVKVTRWTNTAKNTPDYDGAKQQK